MAWHRIRANESVDSLARVVSIAVETERGFFDANTKHEIIRPTAISARACTQRAGKITRRSHRTFYYPSQLWSWLLELSQDGKPVNIFVLESTVTLPCIGLWQAIDLEQVRLVWREKSTAKQDVSDSSLKKTHGLLCLAGPPTIVIGRLPSGSLLRVFDLHNWGPIHVDLSDFVERPDELDDAQSACNDTLTPRPCERTSAWIERIACRLFRWVTENDLGMFRWTLASQAFAAWRHRFMQHEVICHDERQVQDFERLGYYGGRNTTYYCHPITSSPLMFVDRQSTTTCPTDYVPYGPIYHLDVTGLYPSVMRDHLYPYKLRAWHFRDGERWTQRLPNPLATMAEVVVKTKHHQYPYRVPGRTIYPHGTYRTILAGPELDAALWRGDVLAIGSWSLYDLAELFTSYIDYCYKMRLMQALVDHKVESWLWKQMMNALSGKFAQRNVGWSVVTDVAAPGAWKQWYDLDATTGQTIQYRSVGWTVQRANDLGPAPNTLIPVSAWITSYGRLKMDDYRDIVGSGHCYYQAVDSLHISEIGYRRLLARNCVDDGVLGKLRLEAEYGSAHYKGHNYYSVGGKEVCAGRHKDAVPLEDGSWEEVDIECLDLQARHPQFDGVQTTRAVRRWPGEPPLGYVNRYGWVSPPTPDCTTVYGKGNSESSWRSALSAD